MAKIMFQGFIGDFGERAREFKTSRSGTNNHKRKPRPCVFFGCRAFRTFKRKQNFLADVGGFFDCLEAGRHFPPGVISVVRRLRTGRNNQGVILKLSAITQCKTVIFRVNAGGFAEQHFCIFLFTQHAAQRRGDLSRR